jgi:hypothetical protein
MGLYAVLSYNLQVFGLICVFLYGRSSNVAIHELKRQKITDGTFQICCLGIGLFFEPLMHRGYNTITRFCISEVRIMLRECLCFTVFS